MKFVSGGDLEYQLEILLNQGLELHDNFRGAILEFTSSGEEDQIEHNLGFTPIGWHVIYREGEVEIWTTPESKAKWTGTHLFLQSNVPNVLVRLFVM